MNDYDIKELFKNCIVDKLAESMSSAFNRRFYNKLRQVETSTDVQLKSLITSDMKKELEKKIADDVFDDICYTVVDNFSRLVLSDDLLKCPSKIDSVQAQLDKLPKN